MAAMRAVICQRFSPDAPLEGLAVTDHPDPRPPDGWEVVRVRAASLNHHDLWTLRGVGIAQERLPIVLGCDAAGETSDGRPVIVHALIADAQAAGSDETLADDASILSERFDGTHAEYVAVPRRNLVPKPEELSFDEAACLPTAWLTAYRMLFVKAGVRPGDRVLIQGAGGGVATAAILLGRAAGLRILVTSRDEAKARRAQALGAHEVYETGARLPGRVEAVLETVGAATWAHSLRVLGPGGTIVVSGATSGPNPPAELQRVFFRQLRVVGSRMGTMDELVALVRFLRTTGVRPLIDSVHGLDEAPVAYERMAVGDVFGKVILRP
jgi:NADPH:quinone reductase-like Zn-dependent oxidoreductase